MPDPNKHKALADADFKIARTCGSCTFWEPANPSDSTLWGRCNRFLYSHEKHTGAMRPGTPSVGTCPKHRFDADRMLKLVGSEDYLARYLPEDE